MTKKLSVAEAKSHLSEVLRQVGERGDRFIIENRGRPVAAVVPLSDLPREERQYGDWVEFLVDLGKTEEGQELADIWDDIYRERSRRMPRPVDLFEADEVPAAEEGH